MCFECQCSIRYLSEISSERAQCIAQLAGKPMVWQGLGSTGEEKWYTALQPRVHNGKYDSMSMDFNTSLYTVAPAPKAMKPSYVLIFQLFLLRGDKRPKTKEVKLFRVTLY